ncbi:MAG: hypothetical protein QOG87_2207 [Actinomycetota bacterium]|jgi:hypothetical protein
MAWTTTRRLVLVLVAGALCAPATGAWAQASTPTPPPGIGAKLLEGPAANRDDPRAHEYIIDHLAPGTTISRKVGFSNGDDQPVDLAFYAASSKIIDGTFAVDPGRANNDLTSWTSFSPSSATVQPGQTVPVTVTIAVPADATRGERYAAALAERATSGDGGVATVSRVGIRIYLSVGPGGAPITSFTIDTLTAGRDGQGAPLVTAQVHNTGERAIDLSGELALTKGPSSLSAGPFPVRTRSTLEPGQSGPVAVPLDRALPNGPWDATITLISGVTSVSGTARLTFPSDAGASAAVAPVQEESGSSPVGAGALALGVLLAALVAWLLLRRRRRTTSGSEKREPVERESAPVLPGVLTKRSPPR